jgi:hypothetical protein
MYDAIIQSFYTLQNIVAFNESFTDLNRCLFKFQDIKKMNESELKMVEVMKAQYYEFAKEYLEKIGQSQVV